MPDPAANQSAAAQRRNLNFGKPKWYVEPGQYDFNDDGLGVSPSAQEGAKATGY